MLWADNRQIGCIIVEHEQNGSLRAEYGKGVLQDVSERLNEEFGKGFDIQNLRNVRGFLQSLSKSERNAYRIDLDAC